jgi:hypothetical protein
VLLRNLREAASDAPVTVDRILLEVSRTATGLSRGPDALVDDAADVVESACSTAVRMREALLPELDFGVGFWQTEFAGGGMAETANISLIYGLVRRLLASVEPD